MQFSDIREAIDNGDFDDTLPALIDLTKQHARRRMSEILKVGDRVEFNDRCSPKYLQGIEGEIVGFEHGRGGKLSAVVMPDIQRPVGRYLRPDQTTRAPVSILDRVAA